MAKQNRIAGFKGIKLKSGEKIEFSGRLKYGGNDKYVSGKARKAIEDFENRRIQNQVEYAFSVDENGSPIGKEKRGSNGKVSAPYSYHKDGAIFSHTHTREEGSGKLGGTFSYADVKTTVLTSEKTMRAKAREGTYSLTKKDNFDGNGFLKHAKKAEQKFNDEISVAEKRLMKKYKDGKISKSEALSEETKAFNTALVNLHNEYIKGKKQFGYAYTLERN